jgi:predicted DNA binding protein
MPRAKLSVTLPEGVWVRSVTESHEDTIIEVVSALTADAMGTALLEVNSPDLPGVLSDIESADDITELDLLRVVGDQAMVQIETDTPLLLQTLQESRIPFDTPLVVEDGKATLTVTATQDRVADLGEQLEAFGLSFDVLYIHQSVDSTEVLTELQQEIIASAIEEGYYDVPRTCTLTELAEIHDVAKSTASERLHRAESKVIKEWAAEALAGDASFDSPELV